MYKYNEFITEDTGYKTQMLKHKSLPVKYILEYFR